MNITSYVVDSHRALLEDCMRVLFYRDCRALNRIQIAKATVEGTVVSDPYTVRTVHTLAFSWRFVAGVEGSVVLRWRDVKHPGVSRVFWSHGVGT